MPARIFQFLSKYSMLHMPDDVVRHLLSSFRRKGGFRKASFAARIINFNDWAKSTQSPHSDLVHSIDFACTCTTFPGQIRCPGATSKYLKFIEWFVSDLNLSLPHCCTYGLSCQMISGIKLLQPDRFNRPTAAIASKFALPNRMQDLTRVAQTQSALKSRFIFHRKDDSPHFNCHTQVLESTLI